MVVELANLINGADTTEQGSSIFPLLFNMMKAGDDAIDVSFDHIKTATSSFTNAAFVPLLDHFSFDVIKRRIRIIKSTRQINEMVKYCLMRAALDDQPM